VTGLEAIQQLLCTKVKTGTDWPELHLSAHRLIATLLQEADVIRMSPEAALNTGLSSVFLPHGLGHLLGLQVHDVAGFHPVPDQPAVAPPAGHGSLRLTRVLEPGFIVTVEPGIYFIDLLLNRARTGPLADAINWPLIETLRPYGGIRIEDNVLVTASTPENLTRSAFHQLAR
jgi:Xaa-Pro dipeptidase